MRPRLLAALLLSLHVGACRALLDATPGVPPYEGCEADAGGGTFASRCRANVPEHCLAGRFHPALARRADGTRRTCGDAGCFVPDGGAARCRGEDETP